MFIPGWIEDLSLPESIFHFGSVSLPFIGSDIRLLPILYGASMIFSFKISQAGGASTQSGMTGKFMMYGMPIMFFFILYNAPAGLLLYWMVMNVISIGQQVYMNKKRSRDTESGAKLTLQHQGKKQGKQK
jgi:YidC/Oxa1 family membrane protein insertase